LATAEGTNKESMTTISEKSKEITHLKSELNNVKQTNESLCDQVYAHFNIFSVKNYSLLKLILDIRV
jgi:hypothetical protein